MIKKLITLVIIVAAGYFIFQGAKWAFNEFMDYSTVERGSRSMIQTQEGFGPRGV